MDPHALKNQGKLEMKANKYAVIPRTGWTEPGRGIDNEDLGDLDNSDTSDDSDEDGDGAGGAGRGAAGEGRRSSRAMAEEGEGTGRPRRSSGTAQPPTNTFSFTPSMWGSESGSASNGESDGGDHSELNHGDEDDEVTAEDLRPLNALLTDHFLELGPLNAGKGNGKGGR